MVVNTKWSWSRLSRPRSLAGVLPTRMRRQFGALLDLSPWRAPRVHHTLPRLLKFSISPPVLSVWLYTGSLSQAVVQRVANASVTVDGAVVSSIARGICVLVRGRAGVTVSAH